MLTENYREFMKPFGEWIQKSVLLVLECESRKQRDVLYSHDRVCIKKCFV